MKKLFIYLAASLVAAALVLALAYQKDLYTWEHQPTTIWIENGTLFDATSTQAKPNPGILVSEGKISCIGQDCTVPTGIQTIDATGKSIMPGLIDLHGHFFGGKKVSRQDNMLATIWQQIHYLPSVRADLIQAGVTSYRSLGDISPAIFDLKKALQQNELAGPRLFIVGPIFTVAGGHPTHRKDIPHWVLNNMTFQSNSPEHVTAKIEQLAHLGVDGIKVVYQGHSDNANDIEMPRMSLGTLNAITQTAKKRNLWVAAHTGAQSETVEAIEAGITSIEHGIRHGNLITTETLNAVIRNQVTYVPTLGREPKGHLNIPSLQQAGVLLGVGTDSPVREQAGFSYHHELQRLVTAGLSDVEAILAATRNGASALKQAENLGTLEAGKMADILIVNGRPWEKVADIAHIDQVILGGRLAYSK